MRIQIEAYNSNWPVYFTKISKHLQDVLQGFTAQIEHIGSTSVSGLAAKPIIDILIGLNTDEDLNKVIEPMMQTGYTYFKKYEPEMPYRRLFVRLTSLSDKAVPSIIDLDDDYITGVHLMPVTNIHILVKDTHHWTRHIAFRDFLRTYPEIRNSYEQLKLELSLQEFNNHLEYNKAKNNFVKQVEQQALNWYLNQAE